MNDGDEYFYDKLEWVRFRVEEEQWNDLSPVAPSERGSEAVTERKSPFSITVGFSMPFHLEAHADSFQASMMQAGLGITEWW